MRMRAIHLPGLVLAAAGLLAVAQPTLGGEGGKSASKAEGSSPSQCTAMSNATARADESGGGMAAMMEKADARLEELVSEMNEARGETKKIDAIVAVVNELADGQRRVHQGMMSMNPAMMQHMMAMMHGESGGECGSMMSLGSGCPMARSAGMGASSSEGSGDSGHEAHHPDQ
jgi:hypothetical protein